MVEVKLNTEVRKLVTDDEKVTGVILKSGEMIRADAVVVATGGISYPTTGSTGDGYLWAEHSGHKIIEPQPALVPLETKEDWTKSLQGLSLKNVALSFKNGKKLLYDGFGEMMFTHFGLTGPLVLSASAHLSDVRAGRYEAVIDLKPALDHKTLDARLLGDFSAYANRDFANALDKLLPQKMIPIMVERSGIDPHKKVNSITREERTRLCDLFKHFTVSIDGFRPINEAIITKGGVDVKQISPKTMGAKGVSGLYFAGEVLDVDAYTGGFNLQIAFSTAVVAGESAALGE